MSKEDRIAYSLLTLRVSVFIVMFMWTLDKFLNPKHAAIIYEKFYYLSNFGNEIMFSIGVLEMCVLFGFLLGYKKCITYGLVLLFHAVSTLSSYKQYLAPYDGSNLLFFAALPMLGACVALYLLRDLDTKFVFQRST